MSHQTARPTTPTGPVIYTPRDVCYCGLPGEHTHADHAVLGPFLDGDLRTLASR